MIERTTDDVTLAMLKHLLEEQRAAVDGAVEEAVASLQDEERLSADELNALREASEGLRIVVESYATEISEGDHDSRLRETSITEADVEEIEASRDVAE